MSSSVAAKKGSHCLGPVLMAQVNARVCVRVCVCERQCVYVFLCVHERQSVCEVRSSTSLPKLQLPQPQKGVIFLRTKWDDPRRNEDQCLVPS